VNSCCCNSLKQKLLFHLIIILSLLLISFSEVFALETKATGTISGVVLDRSTRSPIPSANVIIINSNIGSASDINGKFEIRSLSPGIYSIMASALGYEPYAISELTVTPGRSRNVEFLLQPASIISEEVTISTKRFDNVSPDLPTSTRNLRYEEVRRAPGGSEDVQRMIQTLPGVVNQNDQTNQIVVRGGSPFENMTVLDGIEVDNTNHFSFQDEGNGGGINGLNTEFLQDVTFASGGFSAKYGDRMSSVLDLSLREGSRERFGGAADFGMMGIGGYLEGPLVGKNGSFLASVHKSYLDLLPKDATGLLSIPNYWNGQLKATYDLSPKHLLTINGLYLEDSHIIEGDEEELEEEDNLIGYDAINYNGEKYVFGARLRSLWGHGYTDLVIARSLSYLHYSMFSNVYDINKQRNKHLDLANKRTDINDQIHLNYTGKSFKNDEWSAGFSVKPTSYQHEYWLDGDTIVFNDGHLFRNDDGTPLYDTQPDTFYFTGRDENVNKDFSKYGTFFQYTWNAHDFLSLTGGLRYDAHSYSEESSIDPRFSMNWQFYPRWTLSLAYGSYHQSQDANVYMDGSVGEANRYLPHSEAQQYIFGLNFAPKPSSIISLEAYYKDYDKLLIGEEDIVRENSKNYTFDSDILLADKTKKAWGVEFFAQQKLVNRFYGTFSYSFGKSESEDPAYGEYSSDFDIRHVLTGVLGYKTSLIKNEAYKNFIRKPWFYWTYILPINGDEITISTRYRYISGRPFTKSIWYAEGQDSPEPIYQGHWEDTGYNNERYPDYKRWDIRLDSKHYFGRSALVYYLEANNILDNKNVASYYYNDDGSYDTIYQFGQMFLMGIRYEF